MALIEVRNLSFEYQFGDGYAVENIDMTVEKGDFYAIIGTNGSGKTTLCYALRGFIPHFFHGTLEGEVLVNGKKPSENTLGEIGLDVGIVFQNPFTQISGVALNVYEEIAYGLENLGVEKNKIDGRVNDIMNLLNISSLKDRNPYELSGGQQQKVAIASVLVMEPKILVLDEPTSQLDPLGTKEVFEAIEILKRRGVTIILIEHKLELITEYANKVLVLKDGSKILDGSLDKVFLNEKFQESGLDLPIYTKIIEKLKKKYKLNKQSAFRYEECSSLLKQLKKEG